MVTCAMTTPMERETSIIRYVLSTFSSGGELDAVKGSDSEEISDRDNDRNDVECEESFCVLYS